VLHWLIEAADHAAAALVQFDGNVFAF